MKTDGLKKAYLINRNIYTVTVLKRQKQRLSKSGAYRYRKSFFKASGVLVEQKSVRRTCSPFAPVGRIKRRHQKSFAIIKERKLTLSNLEKHLLEAVKTGQLTVEAFMPLSIITPIFEAIGQVGTNNFELKEKLGVSNIIKPRHKNIQIKVFYFFNSYWRRASDVLMPGHTFKTMSYSVFFSG